MATQEIREYSIQRKAKNIAETPWLVLPGENKESRRLVRIQFIRDSKDSTKFLGLHLELLYQKRKSVKDEWPEKSVDLRKVPNNIGYKFSLDTIQTYELLEALKDAYPIGQDGISSGKRTVIRGADQSEIIITEANKISILKKLTKLLSPTEISNWLSENLESISENLAVARLYANRKEILKKMRVMLEESHSENDWKDFLKENQWIFGSSFVQIIDERRIDIHHQTDLPFKVEGGFLDIVEIKKPTFPFWLQTKSVNYLYRGKFLIPYYELSGAVSQLSKYILQAEKRVSDAEYIKDHGNVVPLKPRGLIVHGRSNNWGETEWEAFRLLNDGLHGIQIVTFDHLLERAEKSLQSMEVAVKDDPKEVSIDDIPF